MAVKERFDFIDHFRGFIMVMMALDHSSDYFNVIWRGMDPLDPLFPSFGQFLVRYLSYFCAPGFLMIAGAMVYWAYRRRRDRGVGDWRARWDFIERGLFLILVQMVWVNASWSGFARLRLWHFSIIGCIGGSLILLTLLIRLKWWQRLAVGAGVMLVHPFLLRIPYDLDGPAHVPMQLFIDAGDFNLYPILPWFAMAMVGSVMAHFWFERWRTHAERASKSMLVGLGLVVLGGLLRMFGGGYANIFPHGDFGSVAFFMDQKYPPSLSHAVWFLGTNIFLVGFFCRVAMISPKIFAPLGTIGKTALFFYCIHIPLLAIFTRRLGLFYRELDIGGMLVGLAVLLVVLYPLTIWFYGVKRRSKNHIIKMI